MNNVLLLQEMETGLAGILENLIIPPEDQTIGLSPEVEIALGKLESQLDEWGKKLKEIGSQTVSTQNELNETEKYLREQVKGFQTLRKHLQG